MELLEAAGQGDVVQVEQLVSAGASADVTGDHGQTPLHCAAGGGHLDAVQFLVECKAIVDTHDNEGWTALIYAASGGHLDVVRYLLERGAAVDASASDGWTPLIYAVRGGHLNVTRFLVESGASVDASTSDARRTPLFWAVRDGRLDVVRFLVESGATLDHHSSNGQTPLMLAASLGHLDVVRFLVDAHDNIEEAPFWQAVGGGHIDVVRFLMEHGAAVDAHGIRGETALMNASRDGHLDVVRYLVEHGASVDAKGSDSWTPLGHAAYCGHLNMVQFLVDSGATVDTKDNCGWTPLMEAARSGRLDMVRLLVESGAAVDASGNDGWTPIISAYSGDHLDTVQFLVNAHGKGDVAPLSQAASGGNLNVVRYLVDGGAGVDTRDSNGWTSIMLAASGGHLDVVRFLVDCKANTALTTNDGDTALSVATKHGRHEVVQLLLPLVRYKDPRMTTEHADEHMARRSNIPSSWLIAPFEIEVEPFINHGNVGGNYRGKWLDADVVVKLFVDDATSAAFVDEVRLWHQLRHPNVLKLYGVCNAAHHLFVCEYASKGSLPEYLESLPAEYRTPWKFLYEAALGLEYLHERKIVHGNLRGSNILIGNDGLTKLSGFRLSSSASEGRLHASGDWVRWAAPERLKGEQISLASDVYSLGMCMIEAVSRKVPFAWLSDDHVEFWRENCPTDHLKFSQKLEFSNEQEELVQAMYCNDPRARLEIPAVVNKLERIAEIEAEKLPQHSAQPEPSSNITFDLFEMLNDGDTSFSWNELQRLVKESRNDYYQQMCNKLALIYDALTMESHLQSTLQRFLDLLKKCLHTLEVMSKQNRVCRLSATQARDHSLQGLHRQVTQFLQLVCPEKCDAETRETEWKRLCREQVEMFVSEASETCVFLNSEDSDEDRLALVAILRTEMDNADGKYTEEQLTVLQKTHDEILSKSLEDVHHATMPEWFIPWFELEMNEMTILGEGGFGSVIKAKWLDSDVVVKKLEIAPEHAANADKKREMRRMFEHEVDIWFGLSHPHVVRLFGACHVGRPFFVCELAPNGTLDKYLRHHSDELWPKLLEAALGVQYLHARGIVHGDLKCNNILIGSDGRAKVTDFGLSGVFGDDSTEMLLSGAWHWVAPECILGQRPTFASDIYSLGMCIIEALRVTSGDLHNLPWGDFDNKTVKHYVTKEHILPQRPSNCSDEVWTMIKRMCKTTPADRMLIMTVVDEFEKPAGGHEGQRDETNHDKMQVSLSHLREAISEMRNWIANCKMNQDWESGILKKIYRLLWDRLEQVAAQLFPGSDGTIVAESTTSDFTTLVDHSKQRARATLGITDAISLVKFTELALGGYALHRRLDKFMAAHTVPTDSNPLHDWTSACSVFMGVSASPTP